MESCNSAIVKMENCCVAVTNWMCASLLKLNQDKTEGIVFGSRLRLKHNNINKIIVAGTEIKPVKCVCNIGVNLDNNMDMSDQVNKIESVA